MRLFLFIVIGVIVLFLLIGIYSMLWMGAEEDRRMEETWEFIERDEK